jgi:hypothetical protein
VRFAVEAVSFGKHASIGATNEKTISQMTNFGDTMSLKMHLSIGASYR